MFQIVFLKFELAKPISKSMVLFFVWYFRVSRAVSVVVSLVMVSLRRYLWFINLLLTEREGRTGEYWPEVVTVRTERSEVRTKRTEGQYSRVRPSRSVSKRLINHK